VKKTVVAPGFGTIDSGDLDEPQISLAVATHRENCTDVEVNGLVYPEGGVREQARECLGLVRKVLSDLDGTMHDLTKLCWFVEGDELGDDTRAAIHETRSEFVDRPHYPASCIVGVERIQVEGAVLEVEATATVPDEEWTVETITG
jgi:enamine deaminase RidA (YjgF/YER057c/UK114 family)